jgi:hypothetical protein
MIRPIFYFPYGTYDTSYHDRSHMHSRRNNATLRNVKRGLQSRREEEKDASKIVLKMVKVVRSIGWVAPNSK